MKVRNIKLEEMYGDNKLKVFNKIITKKMFPTDFCNYLGYNGKFCFIDDVAFNCVVLNEDGYAKVADNVNEFKIGIRPVIEYSDSELDVDTLPMRGPKELKLIEFGYFPQMTTKIQDDDFENQFNNSEIIPLANNVTFSTNLRMVASKLSEPLELFHHHVMYHTKTKELFIRCLFKSNMTFTSNINDSCGFYWFKVQPIEWILDRENHLLISKNVLMAGIPYEITIGDPKYNDKFTLNDYLNDIFLPEILALEPNKVKQNKNEVPDGKRKVIKFCQNSFNLTKIKEEDMIKGAIESDIPVFLHGASGDGKSARVKQIDKDSTILYMRNATPESLIGKSIVIDNQLVDIPPTWYLKLVDKCNKEPEKIHILFFDELTNALPSIQSMAFNIVLDKEVNGKWKLPSNTRIVAAGNEMDDSIAANELAAPLYGRFLHVYIKTAAQDWIKWAIDKNIHPLIIAYISSLGDKVLRTKYTGNTPNTDPRKWEIASRVLYQTKNPEMLRELIGDSLTTEFIHFCLSNIITIDDVLNHNYDVDVVYNMNVSLKYATVVGLLGTNMDQIDEVYNFVSIMGSEATRLFEVLWSKNNSEKLEYLLLKKQEQNKVKKLGDK